MTDQPLRRNENTTEATVSDIFRERKPADVPGYSNQLSGGNEGARGDDDSSWVKEPPFVTDVLEIVSNLVVLNAGGGANYQALPEIQCRQYRLLRVYLAYTMAVSGQLSIIPEVFDGTRWFAETLVGGTVTPFNPTGTRFPSGGFGSRAIEGTELRTDVLLAGTARFSCVFDVAASDAFRLNVIDLTANAGNTLAVGVSLAM